MSAVDDGGAIGEVCVVLAVDDGGGRFKWFVFFCRVVFVVVGVHRCRLCLPRALL